MSGGKPPRLYASMARTGTTLFSLQCGMLDASNQYTKYYFFEINVYWVNQKLKPFCKT